MSTRRKYRVEPCETNFERRRILEPTGVFTSKMIKKNCNAVNFTGLEVKDSSRERRRVKNCHYDLTANGAKHEC